MWLTQAFVIVLVLVVLTLAVLLAPVWMRFAVGVTRLGKNQLIDAAEVLNEEIKEEDSE